MPTEIVFRRNKNNHIIFMIIGSNLTGEKEICLLETTHHPVGDHVRQMLNTEGGGSYDENHRLHEGHLYEVVFFPGICVAKDENRTAINLSVEATERFGYGEPLAGIAPHICGASEQMEEMRFKHIAVLHKPILAADFNYYRLEVNCAGGKSCLSSYPANPYYKFVGDVMLAFFHHPEKS